MKKRFNRRITPDEDGVQVTEEDSVDDFSLAIVRDDGQLYSDGGHQQARPLADLGLNITLRDLPAPHLMWSGAGVNRFLDGQRPDPRVVFNRVSNVVDRFMDFDRSLADQQTMCDLSACFVLSTYFLDAFNVTGYLWPTGDRGSGKTRFEFVICEMAYLGMVILAGGSLSHASRHGGPRCHSGL